MRRSQQPPALHGISPRAFEQLEPRMMLHANPLSWAGDGTLTLSFAPDGASIGGLPSTLLESFNAIAPEAQWKEAILRAFQTWAVESNATIGVVPDNGADFGVAGLSRSDPRFGDIRIGAAPLDSGVFAIAVSASDVLSGTWVGDVIFNSTAQFADLDEVFAVALHEAGHVFGIGHSENPLSPMHVHGITPVTTLTPADIGAIRSLYGMPQSDANERANANDAMAGATQLKVNSLGTGGPGSAPSLAYGAITAPGDADYFRLTAPEGYSGAVTITVRSAGISLLAPSLTVLNANGTLLAAAVSPNASGDLLRLTLDNSPADGQFFIRVSGGRDDVFGVGSYSLSATFDAVNEVSAETLAQAAGGALRFLPQQELAKLFRQITPQTGSPTFNDDGKTNEEPTSSTRLFFNSAFPLETRYDIVGSISDASDIDCYRVLAPAATDNVMTIRLRSLDSGGLVPRIQAFGKDGRELSLKVLINGGGEYVIQVSGIESHEMITFSVSSIEGSTAAAAIGNYRLFVGFNDEPVEFEQVAAGVLAPDQPIHETALYVALPQLFHFALAVPKTAPPGAVVMVAIFDEANNAVYRVAARPGDTRTAGSVLLKPGAYRVQVIGLAADSLGAELGYVLFAKPSSDPFAANPDDPTFQPEFRCDDPEHAGLFCYPGEFVSADPYLWSNFTESLSDPPTGLTFQQFVQTLLGDWWTWIWQQMGVNGPPLAQGDLVSVAPAGSLRTGLQLTTMLDVLANDFEPEHETVVAVLRSTTSHGQLTLRADGTFIYVPNLGFEGVDSFTYVASDAVNESREATVRIQVGFRGDYDADNVVDGTDFLVWQRTLGESPISAGSGADGDGDGAVTVADAYVWDNNFGTVRPDTSSTFELPSEAIEPSLASSTELTATTSLADASLSDLSGLTLTSNSDGEKSEDSSFFVPPELPSAKKLSNFQLASRPIQALAARGRAEADVLAPRKRLLLPLEDDVWRGSVDQALEELSATSSGPADA